MKKILSFDDNFLPNVDPEKFGKEFNWWGIDCEENYNPLNNRYSKDDIKYKLNSNGFRCDEFDITTNKKILFLGCSFTSGVGLPLNHTWAYNLLEKINKTTGHNIPFWSLALGGSSLDVQTRLYYHYGMKLKPDIVFGFLPGYRREVYRSTDNKTSMLYPHQQISNPNPLFDYLFDKRTILYETEKNMVLLDQMLKSTNTLMIYSTWGEHYPIFDKIQLKHNIPLHVDNKSREKQHSGHEANLVFANKIYNQYENLILEKLKG